jgi:hypothetical protein
VDMRVEGRTRRLNKGAQRAQIHTGSL